jgi:hypothetical protein
VYFGAIQLLALALFAACLYHCWQSEGRRFAQQWFAVGYLFALLYQVVLVQFRVVSYSDRMLQFGSAPTLTSLLLPALFYISYVLAGRMNPGNQFRRNLLLIFLLTSALSLPIDATALAFDWWSFPSQSRAFLDGIPYFVPLSWGFTGALYFAFFYFVRRIRLRGNGQLYAFVLGAPLITGVALLLVMVAQVTVAILGFIQGDLLLNILLGILLLALPIGMALRWPNAGTLSR